MVSAELFTFTTPRLFFLTTGNVLDKSCSENQNTNYMFNNFLFRKSCCSWKNV